jgi:hypothetical protein
MTSRVDPDLRNKVALRSERRCEYCLIHEDFTATPHQIDHVIAQKHGGPTTLENLALSCTLCTRRKGSDLSSIDPATGEIVPLYNPRKQPWSDHFALENYQIVGKTPQGRATVELLQFNLYERLVERAEVMRAGGFPTIEP